jgi:hypothetical protein
MAEVTMPMEELDALRDKIKNLEADKADLISKQKEVIVHHKYYTGRIRSTGKESRGLRVVDVCVQREVRDRNAGIGIDWRPSRLERSYEQMDMGELLDRGLIEIDFYQDGERTTKDFSGVPEVLKEAKDYVRKDMGDQLDEAMDRARKAEVEVKKVQDRWQLKIEKLNSDNADSLTSIRNNNDKKVKKLTDSHEKSIKALNDEIKDLGDTIEELKTGKKKETLEKKIKELQAKIADFESRGFWRRVIN